jgi:hypothetical protein
MLSGSIEQPTILVGRFGERQVVPSMRHVIGAKFCLQIRPKKTRSSNARQIHAPKRQRQMNSEHDRFVKTQVKPEHRLYDGTPVPSTWLSKVKAPDEISF